MRAKPTFLLLSLVISNALSSTLAVYCQISDEQRIKNNLAANELDDLLNFKNRKGSRIGHATGLAPAGQLPFFLHVDGGTGYFIKFNDGDKLMENGAPVNYLERIKPDEEWMNLTEDRAKALWGEPRVHKSLSPSTWPLFVTFDAHGTYNGEENIYHLDLAFSQANLWRYRVRGPGLPNANWISKNSVITLNE